MNRPAHSVFRPLVAFASALMMTACSAAAPRAPDAGVSREMAPAAESESARTAANTASDTSDSQQAIQRLVIRTASLILVVQDTQAQLDTVTKLADELEGYIASSDTRKYDEGLQVRITLRIPAAQFDTALQRLRSLAVEVREEQIGGQDVTAEYTDLTSRLKNLEAAEVQLREMLGKAEKTEDVLAVYRELVQMRGEIEQVKGRMQFLSQSAAMSTITVTMLPDTLAGPVQVAGWRPEGVLKSAVEALIGGLQTVVTIAIWLLVVVVPIGLLIASPFLLLAWIIRRRRSKQAQAKPEKLA